jgi:hypothetical protein
MIVCAFDLRDISIYYSRYLVEILNESILDRIVKGHKIKVSKDESCDDHVMSCLLSEADVELERVGETGNGLFQKA